jgi:hypothetical protein
MSNISWGVGGFLVMTLVACSHRQTGPIAATEPAAQQAIDETRGRCPTDLNETQVSISERSDAIRVLFATTDPSQRDELRRRVGEVGSALEKVHPSVNAEGKVVQRLPAPRVELRERALAGSTPTQYGWELFINAPAGDVHRRVRADLDEEMRHWRQGECPMLRDEPVQLRPASLLTSTPANARVSPGQDR